MAKIKMEWSLGEIDEKIKPIHVENMEKDVYESKYKGTLTCIHGCDARIKFTERKNKITFYSTWNGEGAKHNEYCEFHVKYKGKAGRKKLVAEEKNREISDEQIERAIDRKIKNLKQTYNGENGGEKNQGTYLIENLGEKNVAISVDSNEISKKSERGAYVTSIEASLINQTYLDRRKCVFGVIKSIEYRYSDNNELYGYANLVNDKYQISAYLPPSFYRDNYIDEINFKNALDILKEEINNKHKFAMVVCFGRIGNKKDSKKDYNINIIKPMHIKINEMTLEEILRKKSIKEIKYNVI
ncbi:hypothetical protein ACH36K_11440 [Clostridium sp. MB05]|uniref:hypothetical protein n=1 Tax=Clostridium sp. MB05 TaxID=3376682 RepID=UPI00398244A4